MNTWLPLPTPIIAIFSDNTESEISEQFPLEYILDADAKGVVEADPKKGILSHALITESVPAHLTVRLKNQPMIQTTIPVVAHDAIPEIDFSLPATVILGQNIEITANASDDVGVKQVQFFMDGALVGIREKAPFTLGIQTNDALLGKIIKFHVVVTDTAGQQNSTQEKSTQVVAEQSANIPDMTVDLPLEMQRCVEGSPVRFQVSTPVAGQGSSSGIQYVEFYLDGKRIGEAYFPLYIPVGLVTKEAWRLDQLIESTSTDETTRAFYAVVYMNGGGKGQTKSRLIRVIANQPPTVTIIAPKPGDSFCAGQVANVSIALADDTLNAGTLAELMLNGEKIGQFYYLDREMKDAPISTIEVIGPGRTSHLFQVPISEELVGTTMNLQAVSTDFHGLTSHSEVLKVPVRADQPPQIAITYPTPGAAFISGMPVEIRAQATDDVGVQSVEFFVDNRIVGSDTVAPFTFNYETTPDLSSEQSVQIYAVATDTKGQKGRSADVLITLGKDEQPPVVNIVSPPATSTEGGETLAEVVENSEVVLKASGYDNVSVDHLILRGVAKQGNTYILTGNTAQDILTGADFAPQSIPGALRAFSSIKLIKVPHFSNASGVTHDRYPVEVTATDGTGNSSTAAMVIAVGRDNPPSVVAARTDRETYLPADVVTLNVQAKDDLGVSAVKVSYFIDGQLRHDLDAHKGVLPDANGQIPVTDINSLDFVPGPNIQAQFTLDLQALGLSNAPHSIRAEIVAVDNRNQRSDGNGPFIHEVSVVADNNPPAAGIYDPVQGSNLYRNDLITVQYKAQDESKVAQIRVSANGTQVHSRTFSAGTVTGSFSYTVPATGEELLLALTATDNFGNSFTTNWRYPILGDEPPVISIRAPAPGSKLVEGEAFTVSASVTDNRAVKEAEFFIKQNEAVLFSKKFDSTEVANAQKAGAYLSVGMHVPHRPEDAATILKIGVRASDFSNLESEALVELEILDDLEPPTVTMEEPAAAFSVIPTTTFNVKGEGSDNIYVGNIVPILIDDQGQESQLPWQNLSLRNYVQTITAPNPNSFGSVVAAQRVVAKFDGRITLPESYFQQIGKTYQLVLKAQDNGINEGRSNGVPLTIQGDTEKPVIEFEKLPDTVFEEQDLYFSVRIVDNIKLSSCKIYLENTPNQPLTERTNINTAEIKLGEDLVVPAYNPVNPESNRFTIVAEAQDSSGNTARKTKIINVSADRAPILGVTNEVPESPLLRGGLAYCLVTIDDDFVSQEPVWFFPLYTSLGGFEEEGTRNPMGQVLEVENGDQILRTPYIEFNYPEAAGLPGQLTLRGKPYLEATNDGKLRVWPLAEIGAFLLKLDLGAQFSVRYRMSIYKANPCDAMTEEEILQDPNGLDLQAYSQDSEIMALDIEPEVMNGSGQIIATWVDHIHVDIRGLQHAGSFEKNKMKFSVPGYVPVTVFIRETSATPKQAMISSQPAAHALANQDGIGSLTFVPSQRDIEGISILAHGVDRFSARRGPVPLKVLSNRRLTVDAESPQLSILSPSNGTQVTALQRFNIGVQVSDNSEGIKSLKLYENKNTLIRESTGSFKVEKYSFSYQVPRGYRGGELELMVVAEDYSSNAQSQVVNLVVQPNEPPQLTYTQLVTAGGLKRITAPERLNYGEFWVRTGDHFVLDVRLDDDAGLVNYVIYRVARNTNRIEVFRKDLEQPECPTALVVSRTVSADILFDQVEPAEYEAVVTDNFGNTTTRTFLVHPQSNMTPQIRITVPAQDQYIAAGTFTIMVGLVATDDRPLAQSNIEIYANNQRLSMLSGKVVNATDEVGGHAVVQQAFESMYDSIESDYSVDMADDYGRIDSPYALKSAYVMNVPSGLIRNNETVEIVAVVKDSEGAVGRHRITFFGAADEIKPEVAVISPEIGYGPPEASDLTLAFRAFDNVKVAQVDLYAAYGARDSAGNYYRTGFGTPLRTESNIEARDFEPITTLNIDTPEYRQLIHVDRIANIAALISAQNPSFVFNENARFDRWIRLVARDAAGNAREREISYPVKIDERPVVDIIAPLNGAKVVEQSAMIVNVNSFDDVGIQSLRLIGTHGTNATPVYNVLLRQPPYQFQVTLPAFDPEHPAENIYYLHVEAIDTYGAAFGDLDKHRATEDISVEIVQDQPPTVAIGLPKNNDTTIEGAYMLVQVNAVDDVGIDRVALKVDGLVDGGRVFTDTAFPYEFLVPIPFGQAGKDLTLSAIATEIRLAGQPRSVNTLAPVVVHVEKDVDGPTIVVLAPPLVDATVVEKRSISFAAEVSDNVRVSSLRIDLLVDKNSEQVYQRVMLEAPYQGSIPVGTIDSYTQDNLDQLYMLMRFVAVDGAGNQTVVTRPVTLIRNQPPQVTKIQILDSHGNNIGDSVTTITEGREIVVSVIANDPEVGVDNVTLYKAMGAINSSTVYTEAGQDETAPFQYHLSIPQGHVGESISFKAQARDMDGYLSNSNLTRTLTIVADQPPTATIIKPDNNESVIIEGQDIDVFVEAIDDLGDDGIDRVVFYLNDVPVQTEYNSYGEIANSTAQEHVYRALITPPEGVQGFAIYAVAYDIMGHSGRSQTVRVGKIKDTVAPKLSVLYPMDGEILTAAERFRAMVAVEDIGSEADRHVFMHFIREYQSVADGSWTTIAEKEVELFRDDQPDVKPSSDPNNFYYIYWHDFVDGTILTRTGQRNERVRLQSRVVTPNHTTTKETFHEIGLPIAERRFFSPSGDENEKYLANTVYYTAVDQFHGPGKTGAMVASWASYDPMLLEPDLGNPYQVPSYSRSGLFIADDISDPDTAMADDYGRRYVYSQLMAGASEMFSGTITEIYADADFVLAAKAGQLESSTALEQGFASRLKSAIMQDPETGGLYLDNANGELLIYTVRNGDGQMGLPYLLRGHVDMPYPEAFGLARQDDLVLVANGNGGVQVMDISNLAAPYHVGYIKPNGYARDVAIKDRFAFIAASHEGLVVADLADPAMPIVATLDTLGVANRLHIEGARAYVTDMAGDGMVSQLNIINIADPYHPYLERVVPLKPARPDLVPDGAYDVTTAGGKAFVSVHYSDQEDKPAQSVVEMIDLAQLADGRVDATVPIMIHRQATADDFACRGLKVARGGLQVAAGKQGIARIDLPALTVLQHEPASSEKDVSPLLEKITIELSHVLEDNVVLSDYVHVNVLDARMGEEVTNLFDIGFAMRNGQPARRFIELTRKSNATLDVNTEYFVTINRGLEPMNGLPLASDYSFGFATAASADMAPDIQAVTPATGSIEGGTPIAVTGKNFGNNPTLYLGGQKLVIDKYVTAAASGAAFDRIEAKTYPNYAGPAAVKVVTASGLQDEVIGAFTYVDILKISFINPPVVRASQAGQGDRVEVIGYGFHDGVKLRAYKSGQPAQYIETAVDNDRLTLYSSEKMIWVVPDFGQAFRGFVDVEVVDNNGRRDLVPNGLFYGRLRVDREFVPERSFSAEEIDHLKGDGPDRWYYYPDPMKLPPGLIMDMTADTQLGLLYVLGKGEGAGEVDINSPELYSAYTAPGWISLIKYQRNALQQAAPMHALGYYNLSQDLVPQCMVLGTSHLYVAAAGKHYESFDTPYEDQRVILVYDRENRMPGQGGVEQPAGKDRDVIYSLPLDFKDVPTALATSEKLLFASNANEGVAVISLADPARPSVIRILRTARVNGAEVALKPDRIHVDGHILYVVRYPSEIPGQLYGTWLFDLTKPSLPQVGYEKMGGPASAMGATRQMAYRKIAEPKDPLAGMFGESDSETTQSVLDIYDLSRPENLRLKGTYDPRGFTLSAGNPISSFAQPTIAGIFSAVLINPASGYPESPPGHAPGIGYFSIFDASRPEEISLLDAIRVNYPSPEWMRVLGAKLFNDGVLAGATLTRLWLIDTLTLDLVSSEPANGAVGVPRNAPVVLNFNLPLEAPDGESLQEWLAPYLSLVLDDGTENGQPVAINMALDANDPRRLVLTHSSALAADGNYKVVLKGDIASRRTLGLFDHTIRFKAGSSNQLPPQIVSVEPPMVLTTGGQVTVALRNAESPVFAVSGQNAPVASSQIDPVNTEIIRFTINVPAAMAGPALLEVINASGGRDELLGGILYVEPLHLDSVQPAQGSVNGGTQVKIIGRGFRPGLSRVQVFFGGIPVAQEHIKLLDAQTLWVITPPGRIGLADVTVTLDSGQSATLEKAYDYQQPIQMNIKAAGRRIYDMTLDPTGVYLVVAAGEAGVQIYNVDASTYTSGTVNPDELLDVKGAMVASVHLPGGYYALGVATYFERNMDRVLVTAGRPGDPDSGRLFIIGFDSTNIAGSSIITELPLNSAFGRGIEAGNSRAVLAMADQGLGIVDIHLQTKAYLTGNQVLPNGHSALDVTQVPTQPGAADLYAVTSGHFDISKNLLVDSRDSNSGSFYLIAHSAQSGFKIMGSVPVPASRVVVDAGYAYLASGDNGLVIVDISNPADPRIVTRVNTIGFVYDVSIKGRMVYLAQGKKGITTVDVTDPRHPIVSRGMEAFDDNSIEVVLAGNYSAISGGTGATAIIQVTPDVVLKIFLVEPINGILDQDAEGRLLIRLRFNKAIDLWPANLNYFQASGPGGRSLNAQVQIVNNDAILILPSNQGLQVGDAVTVLARAGVQSIKPVTQNVHIVLYTLAQDQRFVFSYRGDRPDNIKIEAVVPRRIPLNSSEAVTISSLGIPLDAGRVKVFVSELQIPVSGIESNDDQEASAIITAQVPAISHAGQYDVTVQVEKDGLWQSATLAGGLMVDAPIRFESLTPMWGPTDGGTLVTIFGQGFEPGNTVMEGLKVRIGDVPVKNIHVLSTERMEVITPGGRVGRNDVFGQDRYGNQTALSGDNGFGYGLKFKASQSVEFSPTDIHVDQETGVAVTNGGPHFWEVKYRGKYIQDSYRAATFDLQDPNQPQLVGGANVATSDDRGKGVMEWAYNQLVHNRPFVPPYNFHSERVLPVTEMDGAVARKHLYVANGSDGVACLNFDEQNGLQFISHALEESEDLQVGAIAKSGYTVYAARTGGFEGEPPKGQVEKVNFRVFSDPMATGTLDDAYGTAIKGSSAMRLDHEWLYAAGYRSIIYGCGVDLNRGVCGRNSPDFVGSPPARISTDTVVAFNLFDPVIRREYQVPGSVHDIISYGDFLIVAMGESGFVIMNKERPENQVTIQIDDQLQPNPGPVHGLRLLGNLLFVAAEKGGVVVYSLEDPLAPHVVSAGNEEQVQSLDYFKDRLIGVNSYHNQPNNVPQGVVDRRNSQLFVFDLPGAVVAGTMPEENQYIAENEPYQVTFNEYVTLASLQQSGAVIITRQDTGEAVVATITAIQPLNGASDRFAIAFARQEGVAYQIRINDARNLRSGKLWAPFVGHLKAASIGAVRPVINEVEKGVFHYGDHPAITIKGSGFRNDPALAVYVDRHPVSYNWIDASTLQLPAGSIEMLPIDAGDHDIWVVDHEFIAGMPGAIIMGEALPGAKFKLSSDNGPPEGGDVIQITASQPVILPGTKVVLRNRYNHEIRTIEVSLGEYVSDLWDDAMSLTSFKFRVPGVVTPEIYDVFLDINGEEVLVGKYSYEMDDGRGINLPNYPPMKIGAAETRGDTMFIGVRDGQGPTETNRFLMKYGLEIYDIAIWDRPIRLSQIPMDQPVTGLVTYQDVAYLAAGSNGLVVVDISDLTQPLVLGNFGVPGHKAMDVALNRNHGVLAMAVADELGTGFIRFFDVNDPELDPPVGYAVISFNKDDLIGQPLDIQWQDDQLFVLLRRGGELYLVIFDHLNGAVTHTIQKVERGDLAERSNSILPQVSMMVQHGQIAITTDQNYLVLQPGPNGGYQTIYWEDIDPVAVGTTELISHQGAIFVGDPQGVTDTPTPDLAITDIDPPFGTDLTPGETVRIQFNQLMDTGPATLSAAIHLQDAQGTDLPAGSYTLSGINTLAGGYVDVTLAQDLTYNGAARLIIGTGLVALNHHHLVAAAQGDYQVTAGIRPMVKAVLRMVQGQPTRHYFHGDGTEIGVIQGQRFGTDPAALTIMIGDTLVPAANLISVTDTLIQFRMPKIDVSLQAAGLTVSVTRNGVTGSLAGAVVIQPTVILQDLDPNIGPPQGGNFVDLYGVAFSPHVIVKFGGTVAGDLRLRNASQMQVRVPSGSFGYVDVTVESILFPGELSTLSQGYFYANRETGSVDLNKSGYNFSPVSDLLVRDQILYAITGGSYQALYRSGESVTCTTGTQGQLVVADISDPVHPEMINKQISDQEKPFHLDISLPPAGFTSLALEENNLLLVGGDRLYHLDVTLAADPLVLAEIPLPGTARAVAARNGLVYVTTEAGLSIFQIPDDRRIRERLMLDAEKLGGAPDQMTFGENLLWITLPSAERIVALDLVAGRFDIVRSFLTRDANGNPIVPQEMIVRDDLLLVSSGHAGTVVAFAAQSNGTYTPVAQVALTYLISAGEIHAGRMALRGQTLYVAAGEGDVQVFDISAWLDNRFTEPVTLQNYYAVPGAVRSISLGRGAIYAGTAHVYVNGKPAENPLNDGTQASGCAGSLDTLVDKYLTIVEQVPQPRGILPADKPVEIQFNRIVDPVQLIEQGSSLFEVTLNGVPVQGYVYSQVNNTGTRLFFRPAQPFIGQTEYAVRLSSAISDLQGQTLRRDYRFRFSAEAHRQPVIKRIEPVAGSWRGGTQIILRGENFDAATTITIGGRSVPAADITSRSDTELTFILPALEQSPEENLLVGVTVANGRLTHFQDAMFTYVADPVIDAIGSFELLASKFDSTAKRFLFNAGERAAVRGKGLSLDTQLTVNGKPAQQVTMPDAHTLSFVIPNDTVGPLIVAVSNMGRFTDSPVDRVINQELVVQMQATQQLSGDYPYVARSGDLLLLAGGQKATLATTRDSATPVVLAEIQVGGQIRGAALSGGYAVFCVGSPQALVVYDIVNVYAPKLVNRIANSSNVSHDRLLLVDDVFVTKDSTTLRMGHVRGMGWQELALSAVDIAADDRYLYVLTGNSIQVRPIADWQTQALTQVQFHNLVGPARLKISAQRLLAIGAGAVEAYLTGEIESTGHMEKLGVYNNSGLIDAAMSGELLAVLAGDGINRSLNLLDVNQPQPYATALSVEHKVEIRADSWVRSNNNINLSGDLLELFGSSSYCNLEIPIPNTLATLPLRHLTDGDEPVALQVGGYASGWQNVILEVHRDLDNANLPGSSRLIGNQLQFQILGDAYETSQTYALNLFNPPADVVDGGSLTHDLPWYLRGAPLFGVAPMKVTALTPALTVTGRATQFAILGTGLDQATGVTLGTVTLSPSQWTINADGTELAFTAQFNTPGIHTLAVAQNGSAQYLPAALVVDQALTITNVSSDNSRGSNRVSDTGGTHILIQGTGFNGMLEVHWFEANAGYAPNSANMVTHTVDSQGIRFTTPPCEPGKQYQIVISKPLTNEQVTAPTLLSAVDDTAPKLIRYQSMTQLLPLRLEFSEPVTATGFNVSVQRYDYSNAPSEIVSANFDLVSSGKIVELHLKTGYSLDNNRVYTIQIQGLADLNGNQAVSGSGFLTNGNYEQKLTTSDTLPPRELQLIRQSDNALVTPAMVLTRGRAYVFVPAAIDNMTVANLINYEVRISTDSGLTFGAPIDMRFKKIPLEVKEADQGIAIRVRAIDAVGLWSEKRFDIAVADPQLTIGPLYTEPAAVEELTQAVIHFNVGGDADMIKAARMRVLDRIFPAQLAINGSSATISLTYLNPRLSEMTGDQVPVRLYLDYGFAATTYTDDGYVLHKDITPPTVAIVAPENGASVPMGEVTHVLIQSFDRYGIDRVEVSVNAGAFQLLANPNRFDFTPQDLNPVTITARAVDSNGNVSVAGPNSSITVQPYDPQQAEPRIDIIAPADGSAFHEKETVALELMLRNTTSAQLFMDVGGNESNSLNPAPLTVNRGANDPERFALNVQLPAVDGNIVVVLRLTAGGLTARRFINVKDDNGIDQQPQVSILPAATILSGTQLWIKAAPPAQMDDFSDTSSVRS
ncbi:MAG: Ig-like domain-containing protein, partial [Desulfobacteraceae bacterium]|nr:Ig-like domain-containing protein [Desulfobacteraceae bacterium]